MLTITKEDLLKFYASLQSVSGLPSAKFGYAVAKNLRLVSPKVKEIEATLNPTEEFLKYDKVRADLAESYALKDENGKAKSAGEQWIIDPEKKAEFEKKVAELKEENSEIIKKRTEQLNAFDKAMKDEVQIEIHTIDPIILPENITARQIDGIMYMIEEKLPIASKAVN